MQKNWSLDLKNKGVLKIDYMLHVTNMKVKHWSNHFLEKVAAKYELFHRFWKKVVISSSFAWFEAFLFWYYYINHSSIQNVKNL